MDTSAENIQTTVARRQKAAATTVASLMLATILLSVVAFLGKRYLRQQINPQLDIAVRITVLFLGLGSIAWRRTKLSNMRLQDIGGLQGPAGLLSTLAKTTLQIAIFGAAIAAIGFVATLLTGSELYTYWSGAIAIVVLLYCYPTKSSWLRVLRRFAETPAERSSL